MRSNTSLKRHMRISIGVGMLLAVVMIGYVAWATEGKTPPRPPNDDRGSPKVEANRDRLEAELASIPEGVEVQLTEHASAELLAQIQAKLSGDEAPTPRSWVKSAQIVATTGGFLSVYELGDGIVRLLATAIDHESTDLEDAAFGLAFSAEITKDGIEVTSVDWNGLARFVGEGTGQAAASITDNGDAPVLDDIGPCETRGDTTCCFVATDKVACRCCFGLFPGGPIQCTCVPLK